MYFGRPIKASNHFLTLPTTLGSTNLLWSIVHTVVQVMQFIT